MWKVIESFVPVLRADGGGSVIALPGELKGVNLCFTVLKVFLTKDILVFTYFD